LNRVAKLTALLAVVAAALLIGESRPAQAYQLCTELNGTPCSPRFSHTPCTLDGVDYSCTCSRSPDGSLTWICPI
jgi:hypothetical protein